MKILIETSARHMHVSPEHLETLFGKGFELTVKKELSQPGQYASGQKVTVVGPRGELSLTILGPCRKDTQVEVSKTEARILGLNPPVRESGDIAGSCGCKLVGPEGEVEIKEGVIIAKRHVHATPADAEQMGVHNGEVVKVQVDTAERSLIFGDVVVRVSPSYGLAMHIDTDESNAAGTGGETYGFIVK